MEIYRVCQRIFSNLFVNEDVLMCDHNGWSVEAISMVMQGHGRTVEGWAAGDYAPSLPPAAMAWNRWKSPPAETGPVQNLALAVFRGCKEAPPISSWRSLVRDHLDTTLIWRQHLFGGEPTISSVWSRSKRQIGRASCRETV